MPKPGYYSLTIKEEHAKRFVAVANKNGLGVVEFFEKLADNLPEVELDYVLRALKNAPLFKLAGLAVSEAVKHNLSFIYYGLDRLQDDWTIFRGVFNIATIAEVDDPKDYYDVQKTAGYLKNILDNAFPGWRVDVPKPDFASPPYAPSSKDYQYLIEVEGDREVEGEARIGFRQQVSDMISKFEETIRLIEHLDNVEISAMAQALKSVLTQALNRLAEITKRKKFHQWILEFERKRAGKQTTKNVKRRGKARGDKE